MKSLHIICAKCGSTDIKIIIEFAEGYQEDSGVCFCCKDCGELTSAEELQERLLEENGRIRPKQ